MIVLHIALYALLGTCLTFSVIELGLSGYVVSFFSGTDQEWTWDPDTGYNWTTVHSSAPGILDFFIFNAVWTILVSVAAAVLPWFYARKGGVSPKLNTILGISYIVAFFVTSIFWLACFADIAARLGGGISWSDYLNAMIAFAVLLWLMFLALGILAVLSVCGVLVSDWPGYQSMRKGAVEEQPQGSMVPPTTNEAMTTHQPAV
ncbi:hypothetical protein PDE_06011 [Penicillium oxalicum 114-2]|uniref:MARVEL domain-containing protein n=1 Tax=Penicillium oxalicum (strain 114-2 / CGMCC 5302) TaxID=933388 RepID=S8B8H6_PENO1|nr:hypothetical protein PDE_06011 [Penicillium oxalicum 114-2]